MNLYPSIGDLTCIKFLGYDSFGELFLYKQNNSNIIYAVKIRNKSSPEISKYSKSEIKILKKLNHPNIVKLIKVIDNESLKDILLVMEYCNGGSLLECLENFKEKYNIPFTEEIVQFLTKQIVDALIYIHDNNIIHRNLKSEKIMVHFDNNYDKENLNMMKARIKIIDFSLSKQLESKNALTSTIIN